MKQYILPVIGLIIANMFIYAGNDGVVVRAPYTITHCVPADGGNKLVMHFASLRKLGIFSLKDGKFTDFISVPSDILYTAGASKIIVADLVGNLMKYDLSGKLEESKKVIIDGIIKRIEMGSSSGGPLLMIWAVELNEVCFLEYDLVDIAKMERQGKSFKYRNSSCSNDVHLRASSHGTIWGAWEPTYSPSGMERFAIIWDSVDQKYEHHNFGSIVPGADGRYIYTHKGYYSSDLVLQSEEIKWSESILIPGVTGSFFLALVGTPKESPYSSLEKKYESVNVHIAGDSTPLFNYKIDTGITGMISIRSYNRGSDFTLDRRIYFNPTLRLLAIIPDSSDKVVLFPLDIKAELDKSGKDYLLVTGSPKITANPGSLYQYQMEVLSKKGGLKFKIESGPGGMEISSMGLVTWEVPAKAQPVPIIISIGDPGGNEIFHTFEIKIPLKRLQGHGKKDR